MSDKFCPHCRSQKPLWQAGTAYTREGPKKQYLCKNCRRHTYRPLSRPNEGGKP